MRPDIDQPTTFLRNASITAARQGRPSPVPMQALPPAYGLLRASTPNAPVHEVHAQVAHLAPMIFCTA